MRFVLYLAVIGVAVYLLIALIQARGRRSGGASPRRGPVPQPGPRPNRPVAPDDDPAFLAELDRQRRAAERKAKGGAGKPEGRTAEPGRAGPRAAGKPDAAPSDTGKPDAAPPDTGKPDAAPRAPGKPDAQPRDAEPRDAGRDGGAPPDSGSADSGSTAPGSADSEPGLKPDDGGSGGEHPDPR